MTSEYVVLYSKKDVDSLKSKLIKKGYKIVGLTSKVVDLVKDDHLFTIVLAEPEC